ncbi:unnamed protein product, partial [Meganyctiphanes norvegica]
MTLIHCVQNRLIKKIVEKGRIHWVKLKVFVFFYVLPAVFFGGGLGLAVLQTSHISDSDHGANIDHQDTNSETPLHITARKDDPSLAQLLRVRGADVTIRNIDKQTPLLFAVLMNKFKLTEILLDAGANPNAIDWQAETPLHITARKDDPSVAKLLRVRGADVTIRNIDKLTSYEQAVQNGKMTVATFINGCVVDEMVHEDSSTWQSPDQSIIYYCNATLIYSDRVLGCVVDDKVHEDGSTWQSPDRCIIYYCNVTLVISEEGLCTGVTQPSSNAPTKPTKPSTVGYSALVTVEVALIYVAPTIPHNTATTSVQHNELVAPVICLSTRVVSDKMEFGQILTLIFFSCIIFKVDDVIQRRNYIYDKINQPERKNVLSLSTFSVNEAYGCGQTDGQLN